MASTKIERHDLSDELKNAIDAGGNSTPAYTYGTEDLEAGVTELPPGTLHFVYEP